MAVQHKHPNFALVVPPGALVAEDLREKIAEHGGNSSGEGAKVMDLHWLVEVQHAIPSQPL